MNCIAKFRFKVLHIYIYFVSSSDRGQKSHHGRGYNTVGSRHHRPPTNITTVNGVGVDLMCRVRPFILSKW